MADARALKTLAEAFLHPEIGVKTTDGASFGRNYYDRPSAPQRMDDEDADEIVDILEDALLLKKAAVAWLHPEIGVTNNVEDATLFGRNYFNRPSAPDVEDVEEANERARILEEAAALKKSVIDWTHPEIGVVTSDPFARGRNYFNRPSAPEIEEDEYADERAYALADAAALKKNVIDWTHPEIGVKKSTTDGAAFGRNYFHRYSAPEVEDVEDAIEAARVLAEAASLKKLAMDYMHPEVGVSTTDATACGRNYFNRYSAPETEEDEFADERAEILEEAAALKKSAVAWLHPEVGVTKVEDSTLFGRNYFNRYSAPEVDDVEDAAEAARVLADALMLKKSAVDYMHPELGVVTCDATGTHATLRGNACGRNYFTRYSAPETEDVEEAEERARILADALVLKKSAVDWTHPEVGVTSVDATAFGRNYFNRYSAPETEEDEFADERAEILEEAAALKKSAAAWLHPEVGVTESAPESFGRNYFDRYSADDVEDTEDAAEAARVLAEAASLKKLAVDYMHPEVGVTTIDATACGRNYFTRYSAPDIEDMDDASECARVLAEAASLKKLAVDYMHPEVGVTATDASVFGRNYFNRYSAPETEDEELAEERARILADAVALEKSAVQYMHPEKPIEVDATAFGRNYFTRYSAPLNLPTQASEQDESPEESQDVATVKSLAAAVKGANLPSTKSTKLSSSDSEFSATKKSASSVNLFGLTEEVV